MESTEMRDIIRAKIEQAFFASIGEFYRKNGVAKSGGAPDDAPWEAVCLDLDLDQMADRLAYYANMLVSEISAE